ncbi:MAG: hypothetical protein II442_05830, partial [Oscillospiraceae bacterium]|nr:hypothetical protein [Oscillospiraceae bacterium]
MYRISGKNTRERFAPEKSRTRALTASGGCDMLSGQKLMKTENTGMYQALKQTFRRVFGEEPTLLFSA